MKEINWVTPSSRRNKKKSDIHVFLRKNGTINYITLSFKSDVAKSLDAKQIKVAFDVNSKLIYIAPYEDGFSIFNMGKTTTRKAAVINTKLIKTQDVTKIIGTYNLLKKEDGAFIFTKEELDNG